MQSGVNFQVTLKQNRTRRNCIKQDLSVLCNNFCCDLENSNWVLQWNGDERNITLMTKFSSFLFYFLPFSLLFSGYQGKFPIG